MLRPEPFEPNYEAIENSPIWQEQIRPWLETLYFDALEGRLAIGAVPRLPNGEMPTVEDFHFWRGGASSIKMIVEMPHAMVTLNTSMKAQEKIDVLVEQKQARTNDYRRQSA